MARTPEGRIEDHFVSECKKSDFVFFKFTAPGKAGVPDRLVIANGHTAFLELKAAGKKPDPLQLYQIGEMRRQGGVVYVADSKEQVTTILNQFHQPFTTVWATAIKTSAGVIYDPADSLEEAQDRLIPGNSAITLVQQRRGPWVPTNP